MPGGLPEPRLLGATAGDERPGQIGIYRLKKEGRESRRVARPKGTCGHFFTTRFFQRRRTAQSCLAACWETIASTCSSLQ